MELSDQLMLLELYKKEGLDYTEIASLEYSNGIFDYWTIRKSFMFFKAIDDIKKMIPVIACVAVFSVIRETIRRDDKQ